MHFYVYYLVGPEVFSYSYASLEMANQSAAEIRDCTDGRQLLYIEALPATQLVDDIVQDLN